MPKTAATARKRTRDPEAARAALLASGLELFERQGYAGTSVQSIVDRAGLTKGAFYHHFESKDDLLRRVHDEFIDYQLDKARTIMSEPGLTSPVRLRRLIEEALMEPMARYKSQITVYLQERRFVSGEAFEEIQRKRDEFERYFVDLIEHGMKQGEFRRIGPARVVAFGIIGTGAWTHSWLQLGGDLSPRQIGETFADMLIDGLIAHD